MWCWLVTLITPYAMLIMHRSICVVMGLVKWVYYYIRIMSQRNICTIDIHIRICVNCKWRNTSRTRNDDKCCNKFVICLRAISLAKLHNRPRTWQKHNKPKIFLINLLLLFILKYKWKRKWNIYDEHIPFAQHHCLKILFEAFSVGTWKM